MQSRLSLKEMADWCRSLGSSLRSGLSVLDALRVVSRRGKPKIRKLSAEIDQDIRAGETLEDAFDARKNLFPPLFLAMTRAAIQSGNLPEVLRRLEDYFRFQIRLRRQFVQQIFWPAIQLIAAIFIVALLIFILGIISQINQSAPLRILGLSGTGGAFIWLAGWFSLFGLAYGAYRISKDVFHTGAVDRLLLRVPVLGPCLEALALSRFCFALSATMDTSLSILESIPLSLRATDNGAYAALANPIVSDVRSGASLHDAFSQRDLFPDEFLEVLASAEVTGTMPESMERLSVQYNETAEHRLAMLNTAVGWGVWLLVAGIIIYMIFNIFITAYLRPMQDAMRMMDM